MASGNEMMLPGAIVLGGALIGLGLYLGLRDSGRGAPSAATTPSAPATLSPPPVASSSGPPPLAPASSAPPEASSSTELGMTARSRVEQQTKDFIDADKKAKFIPQCWEPALAKEPKPATSKYVFQIAYGPDGKESVRGISELRGESRADVARCLRDIPMGYKVTPPPGTPIMVELTVEFP
jgi:hypothetical protein